MAAASIAAPAQGLGAALRQKAAAVIGEKLHLAICGLVRHELLGVRQRREGLGFSVVTLKHFQSLGRRDHLVSPMGLRQVVGRQAISIRAERRPGQGEGGWRREE